MTDRATFPLAVQLRSETGVPLGELFAHLSGLYFRGKLAYARRFAKAPRRIESAVWVITPDRGLVPVDAAIGVDALRDFVNGEIRPDNPSYCLPLEASAQALAARVGRAGEFVLLGSIASEKYVQILGRVLGPSLKFPAEFVGRGDMSRGGLLLRAAAAGRELEYIPVLGAVRRGSRPPKLKPLRRHAASSAVARDPDSQPPISVKA